MSFWSKVRTRRDQRIEKLRSEAFVKAMARGATPEQARKAADQAGRGTRNAAILGAINS